MNDPNAIKDVRRWLWVGGQEVVDDDNEGGSVNVEGLVMIIR